MQVLIEVNLSLRRYYSFWDFMGFRPTGATLSTDTCESLTEQSASSANFRWYRFKSVRFTPEIVKIENM